MGDRLAIIDMGRKVGGCCTPFRGEELAPSYLTQCRLVRGLPLYQVFPDAYSRLATIDMGR